MVMFTKIVDNGMLRGFFTSRRTRKNGGHGQANAMIYVRIYTKLERKSNARIRWTSVRSMCSVVTMQADPRCTKSAADTTHKGVSVDGGWIALRLNLFSLGVSHLCSSKSRRPAWHVRRQRATELIPERIDLKL